MTMIPEPLGVDVVDGVCWSSSGPQGRSINCEHTVLTVNQPNMNGKVSGEYKFSKQRTLSQRLFNVGTASAKLAQH